MYTMVRQIFCKVFILLNIVFVTAMTVFILSGVQSPACYQRRAKQAPPPPVLESNVPLEFWEQNKHKNMAFNRTCAKYPDPIDLNFHNTYWQELVTSNGTFHLYAAYLDTRIVKPEDDSEHPQGPTVRILGMLDRIEPTVITHCQVWFDYSHMPVLVKVQEYRYIWHKSFGNYRQGAISPYLLACPLPDSHKDLVPVSVSLVEAACDMARTSLRVVYNQPAKGEGRKRFAVCVKGLAFPEDLSIRLTEWIELLAALGAHKVVLYSLDVHPNVTKVLDHYSGTGQVEVTPLTLPYHLPGLPGLTHQYLKARVTSKRQNELIPYNDCFYRNMYR
jgi:hypothetical protein